MKGGANFILLGDVELDDPSLEGDRDSVSSIARVELRQNVGDAAFDSRLCNEKNIGDLLVGIPGCNQNQNLTFALAQFIISGVFSQLGRDSGGILFNMGCSPPLED